VYEIFCCRYFSDGATIGKGKLSVQKLNSLTYSVHPNRIPPPCPNRDSSDSSERVNNKACK